MSKSDVRNEIKAKLLEYGFKRKSHYVNEKHRLSFIKKENNNILSISFGEGWNSEGHTQIYPNIGIGYIDINKLYAKLSNIKRFDYPILLEGIGNLKPVKELMKWDFNDYGNNDNVLSEMVSTIFQYAEPYWKGMSVFDNLYNAVVNKKALLINVEEERILPILHYLKGEKEKGKEIIEETLNSNKLQRTPSISLRGKTAQDCYLDFAEKYEQLP